MHYFPEEAITAKVNHQTHHTKLNQQNDEAPVQSSRLSALIDLNKRSSVTKDLSIRFRERECCLKTFSLFAHSLQVALELEDIISDISCTVEC